MNLRTFWKEIKRLMTFWETVDRIPNWAWRRLDPWTLRGFEYRIVKGKHYIYKAGKFHQYAPQNNCWHISLFRKKRIG